jgi:hypothetical protein
LKLTYFQFEDTAGYVVAIIKRDFEGNYPSIPPHGRWQHFEVGGVPRVTQLLQSWPSNIDTQEQTRRLVDLFLVSVLLDAGAGTKWSYTSKENGQVYKRSEGLAVASLEMFKTGLFSSDEAQPYQVDAKGLSKMTVESLAHGMQVSDDKNPMSGLEGRAGLLMRLSEALQNREMFGKDGRPGNMIGEQVPEPFGYFDFWCKACSRMMSTVYQAPGQGSSRAKPKRFDTGNVPEKFITSYRESC